MLIELIKSFRIRQWTKNIVVFAAIVFDRQLMNPASLGRSVLGFFVFCLVSSSIYIINDILDIHEDRLHPTKRYRPIASGKLPLPIAIAAWIVLLVISIPAGFWLSPWFGFVLLVYIGINVLYSKWLKHIPIIDVMVIAAGFVLRVGAGVTLIHVERFSPWLYLVILFGALLLGFGKRRAELASIANHNNLQRKVLDGYALNYLDYLLIVVSTATIMAYSLYTFSAPNMPANHSMMLTIPFVLYGIFRYLYIIHVEQKGESPEDLLITDRPIQITILAWGITVVLIFYIL